MANETKKKKRATKIAMPKRKPGEPIDRPHLSRANPLADLLFSSVTPEMVAAAGRGEEWSDKKADQQLPKDQIGDLKKRSKSPKQSGKFSTGAPDSGGVQDIGAPDSGGVQDTGAPDSGGVRNNGFLALPHAFLDHVFSQIAHYSAFKVYLYLYRAAFRWIHDEQVLNAKCNIQLTAIARDCSIPNSVVREALKILIRDDWITVENRPGMHSIYLIKRPGGAPDSGGVGAPDSGGHLKNDHEKNHDDKERRSSSKKREESDDDSLPIVKQVYQELTGNTWTAKDTERYIDLIKTLRVEDIIRYLRAIHERTDKPVGSFAYFAKSIAREQQSPKTRRATLKKLRQLVQEVRTVNTGRAGYLLADFREDIKIAAARAAIPYTPDLLEEALKP